MKIFDAHIHSDTCSDADLKNLSYFETRRVLTAAHAPRAFERAADLLDYFRELIDSECPRLRRCGLIPHVALGVVPKASPRRTHYEVWRELPALLECDEVVALGEVGVLEDSKTQWDLFERQVRIAMEHGPKPLLLTPPLYLRATMTYKMLQVLERVGYPPERAMINFLDERLVANVVQSGCVAGLAVGASSHEPRQAAGLVCAVIEALGSAERIVLNSGLRSGGADVLGVPKTIVALQELGVASGVIEELVWANAMQLFLPGITTTEA
ncbi:MAG: hypothetical protein H0U74_16845 [Bradymonadaceae bacterium]|nr:hypothetical protein [Lujinxingiaceae bacterium]